MAKIKAVVVVKVYKEFEYPKPMLHKDLFMRDALNKARNDMQVFVDEIVNNDHGHLHHDMFKYEATEELGYKFRNRPVQEMASEKGTISLAKAAKALTTSKMEAKHGQLNPEVSPQLFEHDPEQRSKDGVEIIREEQWYMKEKIEREFYDIYDEYLHLLRNLK